jgi:hypothetical protein
MSQQSLNYGAFADDPSAEDLYAAAQKIEANFDELYALIGGLFPSPYVSGNKYGTLRTSGATFSSLAANTLYAAPFFCRRSTTFNAISMRIATGAASTKAQFGIYSNVDGKPGALLYQSNNEPSTASNGSDAAGTFASNPTLAPGLYWLAVVSDGAPQPLGTGTGDILLGLFNGATTVSVAAGSTNQTAGYTGSFTYNATLPSSFPTPSAVNQTPVIVLTAA